MEFGIKNSEKALNDKDRHVKLIRITEKQVKRGCSFVFNSLVDIDFEITVKPSLKNQLICSYSFKGKLVIIILK
jgi:hypothetical protein